MNNDWKNDPLLKQMSHDKIEFLTTYARQLSEAPKDQLMNRFLTMQNNARQKKISFNNAETDLMLKIFSSHMSPQEQKRMENFTLLAKKLAAKS